MSSARTGTRRAGAAATACAGRARPAVTPWRFRRHSVPPAGERHHRRGRPLRVRRRRLRGDPPIRREARPRGSLLPPRAVCVPGPELRLRGPPPRPHPRRAPRHRSLSSGWWWAPCSPPAASCAAPHTHSWKRRGQGPKKVEHRVSGNADSPSSSTSTSTSCPSGGATERIGLCRCPNNDIPVNGSVFIHSH